MLMLARRLVPFLILVVATVPVAALQAAPRAAPGDTLSGRLLVAAPSLKDPNFAHAVVYLMHHDANGAIGLVINRVLASGPLSALLEDFGMQPDGGGSAQIRIHSGGPVEQGEAFVLHSTDYRSSETVVVDDHVALTRSLDVLRDMAEGAGPEHAILALGHAGWGPGQLESEIVQGAWDVVPADEALLFDEQVETKWQRALRRRGIDL